MTMPRVQLRKKRNVIMMQKEQTNMPAMPCVHLEGEKKDDINNDVANKKGYLLNMSMPRVQLEEEREVDIM